MTDREQVAANLYGHLAGLSDSEMASLTRWSLQVSRTCDRDGQHKLRGALVALGAVFMVELEAREQARVELAELGFDL